MYAGKVAEESSTSDLFAHPRHPYTRGLLASVPSYEGNPGKSRLTVIPGLVPDLRMLPTAVAFRIVARACRPTAASKSPS